MRCDKTSYANPGENLLEIQELGFVFLDLPHMKVDGKFRKIEWNTKYSKNKQ